MERKGKLEELDRSFDLKFGQVQGDAERGIHKPQVTTQFLIALRSHTFV